MALFLSLVTGFTWEGIGCCAFAGPWLWAIGVNFWSGDLGNAVGLFFLFLPLAFVVLWVWMVLVESCHLMAAAILEGTLMIWGPSRALAGSRWRGLLRRYYENLPLIPGAAVTAVVVGIIIAERQWHFLASLTAYGWFPLFIAYTVLGWLSRILSGVLEFIEDTFGNGIGRIVQVVSVIGFFGGIVWAVVAFAKGEFNPAKAIVALLESKFVFALINVLVLGICLALVVAFFAGIVASLVKRRVQPLFVSGGALLIIGLIVVGALKDILMSFVGGPARLKQGVRARRDVDRLRCSLCGACHIGAQTNTSGSVGSDKAHSHERRVDQGVFRRQRS